MQKTTFIGLIMVISSCSSGGDGGTGTEKGTTERIVDTTELSGDFKEVETIDSTMLNPVISELENDSTSIRDHELTENEEFTQNPQKEDIPVITSSISFESQIHEFGRVTEGEIIVYTFNFTNIGKAPLVIKDVLSSCGCTVPEYSKEPVMPAAAGSIKISFDTKGRLGVQEKLVTIVTNGDPISQILRVKGTVSTD